MTIDEEALKVAELSIKNMHWDVVMPRDIIEAYEQAKKPEELKLQAYKYVNDSGSFESMGDSSTSNDEAQAHKIGALALIGVSPAQLGDACNIDSPATALVQKLVDALREIADDFSMYYDDSEDACGEHLRTIMGARNALTEAQSYLKQQEGKASEGVEDCTMMREDIQYLLGELSYALDEEYTDEDSLPPRLEAIFMEYSSKDLYQMREERAAHSAPKQIKPPTQQPAQQGKRAEGGYDTSQLISFLKLVRGELSQYYKSTADDFINWYETQPTTSQQEARRE